LGQFFIGLIAGLTLTRSPSACQPIANDDVARTDSTTRQAVSRRRRFGAGKNSGAPLLFRFLPIVLSRIPESQAARGATWDDRRKPLSALRESMGIVTTHDR
jgi:hypothetical protein